LIGTYLGEIASLKRFLDILPTCAIGAVLGPILVTMSVQQSFALVAAALLFIATSRFLLSLSVGVLMLVIVPFFDIPV
jgi:uncharacterized membrane protein